MLKKIEFAFDKTIQRYNHILNAYYPAHNGTGFTERNLTNNFVSSLELALEGATISWFEAPLSTTAKKHLDAVVFHPESKTSFLIEAKRLSNLPQKINEIKCDIERMKAEEHHSALEHGLRNFKIENRFAIIITDVWLESGPKVAAYQSWPECVCKNATWAKEASFNSLEITGSWKENYKILIAVIKI